MALNEHEMRARSRKVRQIMLAIAEGITEGTPEQREDLRRAARITHPASDETWRQVAGFITLAASLPERVVALVVYDGEAHHD